MTMQLPPVDLSRPARPRMVLDPIDLGAPAAPMQMPPVDLTERPRAALDPEAGGEGPSPDEIRQAVYAAEDARQKAANLAQIHPVEDPRSTLDKFLDAYQMPEYAAQRHEQQRAAMPASKGVPALLAALPDEPAERSAPPAPAPAPATAGLVAKAQAVPAQADMGTATAPPAQPSAAAPPPVAAPSPAAAALADPGFAAYVQKRAAELAAAQGNANDNQRWADAANASVKSMAALDGKDVDMTRIAANNARAQMPVQQVVQRQQAETQAGKDFETQQEVGAKSQTQQALLDSMMPGSSVSQRGYLLAVAQKLIPPSYPASQYTESMRQDMLKGATIEQAREQHQAVLAEMQARMGIESRKADEERRHNMAEEALQGRRELPPNVTTEIGSLISGANGLGDLDSARGDAGITGAIADKLGFGNYHAVKSAVASEIAKADSKGRVNPAGAARLEAQMPGPMTPGATANFAARRKALLDQADQRITELEHGRFNPDQVAALRAELNAARAGSAPSSTSGATHYLVSPDRKLRMPADANGKPIGPAEPNTDG